ncbi:MAG: His-Xaa-Ser system protein HxsD [Gammaproteobacteria bacterium]
MPVCEVQYIESNSAESVDILIDLGLYSVTAVKKSCYKFTADCSIQINSINQNKLRLILTFPISTSIEVRNKLIADFHNELLDQDLREIISKEAESVRNLILAESFSKTSILESE